MQIGIDTFAATSFDPAVRVDAARALSDLLDRVAHADAVGLDVFGLGEHHRPEYLDASPPTILAAAAMRTRQIRLTSAVTVLSAADPVRVFQAFATLDLLSGGRAEIVAGRGSFTEAFGLFGLDMADYDALFEEKLDLLLRLRASERVTWEGQFRPPLVDQPVYPRPVQTPLPVWVGVGGTPASFVRAGLLGLPLMVAVIGGETHRFRPLVDLYRQAGAHAGHAPEALRVGLHALGYVGETDERAAADYFPGYQRTFTRVGRERGWPPVTRAHFDALRGPTGALLVGSAETVAAKITAHARALGGLDRVSLQMDHDGSQHADLMGSIERLGADVAPAVRAA